MPADSRLRSLREIAEQARRAYVAQITGEGAPESWWTAVIVTASSERQAERYEAEIERRRAAGKLPRGALFLVVPDRGDRRMGSGGATLNALRALAERLLDAEQPDSLESWWRRQRVLVVHSGGDSRRLPEYSLAGKLFSALPVKTPWGEVSTVFDETMALSTAWAGRLESGLLVASGDVILTFPASQLQWDRPGVCGVAMRQPVETGSQHGVYVLGDEGRVYSFLQKPSAAEVKAAGGLLPGGEVALDIGLLRFDAPTAARLTELAGVVKRDSRWELTTGILGPGAPEIDLYQHVTLALTGQYRPAATGHPSIARLAEALRGTPFWCSLVDGEFTHIGTTSHFHRLMTQESRFRDLYRAQLHLGGPAPPGVVSSGVVVDSVFRAGAEIGPESLAIECLLDVPLRTGRGAIAHGLMGIEQPVEIPPETVVHQIPVRLEDGGAGVVFRVYGIEDDPKQLVGSGRSTWFGRPIREAFDELGIRPEDVWPGVPEAERSLWNAALFAAGPAAEAWKAALWLMGFDTDYSAAAWRRARRLSLAESARLADTAALAEARTRRLEAGWELAAVSLAETGADLRPMLARAPGLGALARAGRRLRARARELETTRPTEAASLHFQAGLFFAQAGLEQEGERSRADAFGCVQRAVDRGSREEAAFEPEGWRHSEVHVRAPARVDFGGGWSDTPPFCLDWGGAVLNAAVCLDGRLPVTAAVRRLEEPLVRCHGGGDAPVELKDNAAIFGRLSPGLPAAIPRAALRLLGIAREDVPLPERLAALGGGLEIRTAADLPLGSGLGTSSILGAALIKALAVMAGIELTDADLSDQVMRLEQLMTTGGGWQDQAGGIFPGVKLVTTGPGLRQRLRVEALDWSEELRRSFHQRFVLYYTGLRRVAKDLLAQVVGNYLTRRGDAVQVLHSIKTLALEMRYAMLDGDWTHLGELMRRHWELNKILDPHTTNAPIEAILDAVRPYVSGCKLAGAGGGGFLMMMARGPEAAGRLRKLLSSPDKQFPGRLHDYSISQTGLAVETG